MAVHSLPEIGEFLGGFVKPRNNALRHAQTCVRVESVDLISPRLGTDAPLSDARLSFCLSSFRHKKIIVSQVTSESMVIVDDADRGWEHAQVRMRAPVRLADV